MIKIKTAEERARESGRYADPLEIVIFHRQEIAELRAALEVMQKQIDDYEFRLGLIGLIDAIKQATGKGM